MTNKSAVVEKTFDSLGDYSLQFNRWLLISIGAWPASTSTSRRERIISFILIALCYGFILFTVIPCIFHFVLEDESIYMKLKVFGPLSHWFIGGINYTNLLLRSNEIRDCIHHVQTDWKIITRPEDSQVMMKYARIGRFIAAFCATFMQGGVLTYCVVTAFATQTIEIANETRIIRMLPCAAYKNLIPVDSSPMNEIVLATQFISGFIVNSSAVAIISIGAVFTAHAYGQLTVLMRWINEFVNRSEDQKKSVEFNEIGEIVEHHLRILSLIAGIENVLTQFCFMELLKSKLDISMLGYYILTEWAEHDIRNLTTYFMIMASMSFNIFTVCYIGDILTEQSKKFGDVVYMTKWYYLPNKDIFDLILIITRSNSAIKITAGKITHMSINTFGDVMKTAFAYLNLLRQVT
ncbi:odorant receptor 4-like [Bombus huntii]|uniref:odorant receptor 4-like n=1 Tax=Bombus huntii TaxID=85661 RepID=UPI0021AAAD74|nr:odorant receptor 4-like [Bombus huntii]